MSNRCLTPLLAILTLAVLVALPAAAESGKVNINNATAEQLALLPRVGPVVAERIVEFRDRNGRFKSTQDLMLVQGIGEKTFELILPYIDVEGETTLSEKVSARSADQGDR